MIADPNRLRDAFPVLGEWVYLNSAGFGPVPRFALEAADRYSRRRDEMASLDFLDWYTEADRVRASAARLIGASGDDIAFVPNAGAGLGWLMGGIDWREGDHVITLAHEFPNNVYFPEVLAKKGVRFTRVEMPGGVFSPDRFVDALSSQTRLVLLSWINYSTGLRVPFEALGAELRARGILFCVDGTQGVGALQMDVAAARIDFLVVDAYKWMLSPPGIGFACVSPRVREWLPPAIYSWRSHRRWRDVDQLHDGVPELPDGAIRYEGGMQNFGGIFALGAVLDWMHELGPSRIEERVLELASKARAVLRDRGGRLAADQGPGYDSPIVTARFPEVDSSKLAVRLEKERIAVTARKGNLRVSPHVFNNEEDIEKLSAALKG